MNTEKLLDAMESAKKRILAHISPETLKEITDAVEKEAKKKGARDRTPELRNPDRGA